MGITKEQIEQDASALMEGRSVAEHARPSFVALLEYKNGIPIDQVCPYCRDLLWVEDHVTAWTINCPCGRSKNSWRGL
jgi:hypothetical protein